MQNNVIQKYCQKCGKNYLIDKDTFPGLPYCKVVGCKNPKEHSINYHDCVLCGHRISPKSFIRKLISKL